MKLNFVSFLVLGFGLFGTGWCSLLGDQEPSFDRTLEVTRQPQEGPVINPENGYIFDFMSRGFDKTSQSLFGNLSLGALKKRIFKYNPLERVEATRVISEDGSVAYFVPKFIQKFYEENSSWDQAALYKTVKQLNQLLDAKEATFQRRGYASQVLEVSQYGVSALTVYYILQWKAELGDISIENYRGTTSFISDYLEDDFVKAIQSLPEYYNEQTQEEFSTFINDYGMHYLTHGQFGGMILLETKGGYKADLKVNSARVVDADDKDAERFEQTIPNLDNQFENFTYGGDRRDITSRHDFDDWLDTVKFSPVLLDGYDAAISKLIEIVRPESDKAAAARAFDKAIEVAYKKYRIRAYLEALEVVQTSPGADICNLCEHAEAEERKGRKILKTVKRPKRGPL